MNEAITEKNYPIEVVWVLKTLLGYVLAILLLSIFLLFDVKNDRFFLYLVVYTGVFLFSLLFTILRRLNFHYSIEEGFMTLKQGILSKQQRHIPYGVIQNLFVKQDLFDRVFGLASLTIENASQGAGVQDKGSNQRRQQELVGFKGNRVSIPGLKKENAEALKNIVLRKMKENPIEDSQSGL